MSAEKKILEFDKHTCKTSTPSRCKPCRKAAYRATREGMPDTRKTVVLTEDGRVCIDCEQPKSWDNFVKDVWGYNEKSPNCKSCRKKKFSRAYEKNIRVRRPTLKERPDKLMRLYGITYADVERMFSSQFGLCANHACGKEISLNVKPNEPNRAVIDHNHTMGKVRALLCGKCNLFLGQVENNKPMIIGLMDYLNKHNSE